MQVVQNSFFCTTPYQIITSVVLNSVLGGKSDIYIVPQFKTAEKCAENLSKLNIFNQVVLVDTSKIERHKKAKTRFLMHAGIVRQYLNIDAVVSSFLLPNTRYEKMFVSSKAYIPRMAYLYSTKHGLDTELVYYDDGEGSYYNKYLIEASSIDKLIRRLLFGKEEANQKHRLYLYEPSLFVQLNGSFWEGEIVPIPHVLQDERFKCLISRIFDIADSDLISERVIILDVLKNDMIHKNDVDRLFEIYGEVQKTFGYKETIVKKHPRDTSGQLASFKCFENYNIPFECLCTQVDMNEKVLIAISSTATIIPKVLMGQEPIVILLYKLIEQRNQNDDYKRKRNRFYQLCKDSYTSQDRFFVPETRDDLMSILNAISNDNKMLARPRE